MKDAVKPAHLKMYITSDRYLVAALLSNGTQPVLVAKDIEGMTHYGFNFSRTLGSKMKQYDQGRLKVNTDFYEKVIDTCNLPYDWSNDSERS